MYYGGPETVRKYDKFKEEIFGKKTESYKADLRHQKPAKKLSDAVRPSNHPFLKKFVGYTLFYGATYFIFESFDLYSKIKSLFVINPIKQHGLTTLYEQLVYKVKSKQLPIKIPQKDAIKSATDRYFKKILKDFSVIQLERNIKKISQEHRYRFSLGFLKFGNKDETILMDKWGNVVRNSKQSPLKIGSVSLFGRRTQKILEYQQKRAQYRQYSHYSDQYMQQNCKTANLLNKFTLSSEDYDAAMNYCSEQAMIVNRLYSQLTRKHDKYEQRYENKMRFFLLA